MMLIKARAPWQRHCEAQPLPQPPGAGRIIRGGAAAQTLRAAGLKRRRILPAMPTPGTGPRHWPRIVRQQAWA